ncbi:MAG: rhomboid family intramembrane serine protease [Venatoribacter sp.]
MEPFVVLVADAELDLSPLTQKLWAERVPHRVVSNEQGQQCLMVANPADAARVKEWVAIWQAGNIEVTPALKNTEARAEKFWLAIAGAPLSALTLLGLIGVFVWMQFDPSWQSWLQFGQALWPNERFNPAAYAEIGLWAFWRPALLHFSLAHIVFNGLWWWILAPQIERLDGAKALLILILLTGLGGNLVQWWYAGPAFGGASGITFGFLGWVGVRLKRVAYPFPSVLLPAMVVLMLITIATDTVLPGISGTANGAHLGGLIAGLLLGLVWPVRPSHE